MYFLEKSVDPFISIKKIKKSLYSRDIHVTFVTGPFKTSGYFFRFARLDRIFACLNSRDDC